MLVRTSQIQELADDLGVGKPKPSTTPVIADSASDFDKFVKHPALVQSSRSLFMDGHYARSVEEAFKCVNNLVKERAGRFDLDGDKLMREVFSAKKPQLKLNDQKSMSKVDEQRGYMELFAGAMTGIRNPRAHEHRLQDNPKSALEMLVLANHLADKVEISTRTRAKRRTTP